LTLDEPLARSEVVVMGIDGGGLDDLLGVTLQTNLKTGDTNKAAEVFIDAVMGSGTWAKWPEAPKERFLANIYTALGEKGRPLTSCDDVKKFDFPVLLMAGPIEAQRNSSSCTAKFANAGMIFPKR
jgi:hypothetical protein